MTAPRAPLIFGIGGTTRSGSSSERALRLALAFAEQQGARVDIVAGRELELPPYDPNAPLQRPTMEFVSRLRSADALIISSAAYHGAISGTLKNAIDYAEELRADSPPYLDGRAIGCIVCAQGAQALGSTLANMRAIVHALRGWNTPYSATINTADTSFDVAAGTGAYAQIEIMTCQVVEFARARVLSQAMKATG
jgi:FMN reductase